MKDFLRDNETLSEFLEQNTTLNKHAVQQIVEANINLEKVRTVLNTSRFRRVWFCSLAHQKIFNVLLSKIRRYKIRPFLSVL